MGERGLKHGCRNTMRKEPASLPMGERGLKQDQLILTMLCNLVAPYGGAWIETLIKLEKGTKATGRSLWGSVD